MAAVQEHRASVRLAPRRLGHSNMFVSDLEAAIRFYESVCGIKSVFREPGIQAGFHSNGNSHHDVGLIQTTDQKRIGRDGHVQVSSGRGSAPGLNHLGFEMENERVLISAWERAKAAGLEMRPVTHGMSHSIYVFDPEGNYLEFYADMIDDWRGFYAANENQLISGDWAPDPNHADDARRFASSFVPEVVEGAVIHPRRISRATILVTDLPRMVDFYHGVAGLELTAGSASRGYAIFAGTADEPCVALFARREDRQGLHHLSFELGPDKTLDETIVELRRRNIPILLQIDNAEKQSVVIADQDGMKLQFYNPRSAPLPDPESQPVEERLYLL